VGKGKRKPEVALRWSELLSGEAALAVALNASLSKQAKAVARPLGRPEPEPGAEHVPKARKRS
jgi:hypothetical protein